MNDVLKIAAMLAFDPVADFKVPCIVKAGAWNYYAKLHVVVWFPPAAAIGLCLVYFGGQMAKARIAWAAMKRELESTWAGTADSAAKERAAYKEHMRRSARYGLEKCASIACGVFDFAFPMCSRSVLQMLRCRKLGPAGYYLEADYSPYTAFVHTLL